MNLPSRWMNSCEKQLEALSQKTLGGGQGKAGWRQREKRPLQDRAWGGLTMRTTPTRVSPAPLSVLICPRSAPSICCGGKCPGTVLVTLPSTPRSCTSPGIFPETPNLGGSPSLRQKEHFQRFCRDLEVAARGSGCVAGERACQWAEFFRRPKVWPGPEGREWTRFHRQDGQCGWWGPEAVDVLGLMAD